VRFLTAGESHGPGLLVIVDGVPANLEIDPKFVQSEMKRRMHGFGRGGRMRIEKDEPRFLSGVRKGRTLGTPIAILIENRDHANWEELMAPFGEPVAENMRVLCPRPGHADLSGVLKRNFRDVRDVLERASARETAARVAAGAIAKLFLRALDVEVTSYVLSIGKVRGRRAKGFDDVVKSSPDSSPVRMIEEAASRKAVEHIKEAGKRGDSLGGSFEVICRGLPPGLGDYSQWDRRLDGLLGRALLGIPAIKGVELGTGVKSAASGGLRVHDRLFPGKGKRLFFGKYRLPFLRKTNNAGGIEGGMTNGEELRVTCYMKPIPTLTSPLETVDIDGFESATALKERSDVCAVPAASVVGEAMVALTVAGVVKEKFGGDTIDDIVGNYESYLGRICDVGERE